MAIHWASRKQSRSVTRAIGLLFAIGSTCFLIGPFPGFIQLVGSGADGTVFFVGSLFFTSAAFLQFEQSTGRDRLPTLIQLAGTLFFNVETFRAMQDAYDTSDVNRLVWAPEAVGSICFLVSGFLAFMAIRSVRGRDRTTAAINLAGCVFFGISTIASYVVPSTGDILALAAANWTTGLGALCFLIGSLMLLPSGDDAESPAPHRARATAS
jgi:hypothetical protein